MIHRTLWAQWPAALAVLLWLGAACAVLAQQSEYDEYSTDGAPANPGPGEIVQKNIEFAPAEYRGKVGETVTFVNADPFGHNAYSATPGGVFDIGLQGSGERKPIRFTSAGTFEVRCRIHPKMKMQIVITR
jgi:plastocyanin